MNIQKQIEALETKLAEVSAELQRLKGQKAGPWVPQQLDNVLEVRVTGYIWKRLWDGDEEDMALFDHGRIFSDTPEGREAAERFAFCEGFRARWKRSANEKTGHNGWLPFLDDEGNFEILTTPWTYGLPKWMTAEACRAFVDSEGGPDKFKEILEKGIL